MKAKRSYRIQSIDRAVSILDVIAAAPRPLLLCEVTEALKLHKSTAHRFLHVLRAGGLLEVSDRGGWRLGPRFEAWAALRAQRGGVE